MEAEALEAGFATLGVVSASLGRPIGPRPGAKFTGATVASCPVSSWARRA
jgi:hypothetical protein